MIQNEHETLENKINDYNLYSRIQIRPNKSNLKAR